MIPHLKFKKNCSFVQQSHRSHVPSAGPVLTIIIYVLKYYNQLLN